MSAGIADVRRRTIDLNCDAGEVPQAIADGTQERLLRFFTSVNIACGGHAGDRCTMETTIQQALRLHLAIGAHPSYPDSEHFGRVALEISAETLAASISDQVSALGTIAAACGARLTHVKPHGALYNRAAREPAIAEAIARGVARYDRSVILVGLAGSSMLRVFVNAGFRTIGEAFADRYYEPDGSLRSRAFADALIANPDEAAQQALRIAERGTAIARDGSEIAIDAQTICIHGDASGAAAIAASVRQALERAGIALRAPS